MSCDNICKSFKFMTIMSATNREGGGSGHGSGRVGSGTAWVGSEKLDSGKTLVVPLMHSK